MDADWHFVRTPLVGFYILRGADGLHLIDTGFVGGRAALLATYSKLS